MHTRSALSIIAVAALAAAAAAQDANDQSDQPAADVQALQSEVDRTKALKEAAQAELDAAKEDLAAARDALEEAQPLTLTQGWDFAALVGMNGSSGNTEAFNFRTILGGNRATKRLDTSVGFSYQFQNSDGEETADRMVAEIANDWLFDDSPWRVFADGKYEYDEFQDWRHRLSGFAGAGYEILDGPKHTLIGRAGAGGNQTWDSSDDRFTPEGFLQADYRWKISDAQRFKAGATFFPSLENSSDFRVNSYAEYQVTLDQDSNLVLVLGAEDRYDSDPGDGANRNDIDYYLTLGWTF